MNGYSEQEALTSIKAVLYAKSQVYFGFPI
jgi:hypothetical protein